jgi:signal transduction histidine kinase
MFVSATLGNAAGSLAFGEALGAYGILVSSLAIGAAVRYSRTSRQRELEQVRSREREVIARDLHDTVAHHVSAIAVQAQAGRTLAASQPEAAAGTLEVIEEAASRTLVEMRAMVGALRQGEEAEYGVRRGLADLDQLADELGGSPDVDIQRTGSLDELSSSLDMAIYRIVQESITNVVRHARGATRVEVRVTGEDDVVRLVVRDDGTGATASNGRGFGLAGMAERAELLGGTLEAGPRADGGWTVVAELPRRAGSP